MMNQTTEFMNFTMDENSTTGFINFTIDGNQTSNSTIDSFSIVTANQFTRNLLIVNLVTFFVMFYDKMRAKDKSWRVPEFYLLALCLRAPIAGIFSIFAIRHKTRKHYFLGTCLVGLILIYSRRLEEIKPSFVDYNYDCIWTGFTLIMIVLLMINIICNCDRRNYDSVA